MPVGTHRQSAMSWELWCYRRSLATGGTRISARSGATASEDHRNGDRSSEPLQPDLLRVWLLVAHPPTSQQAFVEDPATPARPRLLLTNAASPTITRLR